MNGSEKVASAHKGHKKSLFVTASIMALVLLIAITGCTSDEDPTATPGSSSNGNQVASGVSAIAAERGLTEADIEAAVKTFVPSGTHDEYIQFASGGHSGQMLIIGLPSMRLLKVVGVYTPEPWQGWAVGDASSTSHILDDGNLSDGTDLSWGDTHHPALSETAGDYDGDWAFINE